MSFSRSDTVIRTKGRSRFSYNGRPFVWYVLDETQLRIASADKHFVVAFELIGNGPLLSVSGPEFLGISPSVKRPVWIVPPQFTDSIGGKLIRAILDWCFDPKHVIVPYDGPRQTTVQRAWDSLGEPNETGPKDSGPVLE